MVRETKECPSQPAPSLMGYEVVRDVSGDAGQGEGAALMRPPFRRLQTGPELVWLIAHGRRLKELAIVAARIEKDRGKPCIPPLL